MDASEIPAEEDKTLLRSFISFPTLVYTQVKTEFLDKVLEVSNAALEERRKDDDPLGVYPVTMSSSILENPDIEDFRRYVGETSWNILAEQGYAMEGTTVRYTEMWAQEHRKGSSMEYHNHPGGVQLVGFYFLEVPTDPETPRAIIHDPRPAKTIIDLPELDRNLVTPASSRINFIPEPGMLMFANAWLPHSFARNPCDKPFKFIHFNLAVTWEGPVCAPPSAEVI